MLLLLLLLLLLISFSFSFFALPFKQSAHSDALNLRDLDTEAAPQQLRQQRLAVRELWPRKWMLLATACGCQARDAQKERERERECGRELAAEREKKP